MPYIITTLNTTVHGEPMEDQSIADVDGATRTAVATLDEARWAAVRSVRDADYADPSRFANDKAAALDLPESGSTVGPLPDGTVIEVQPVDWTTLADMAGFYGPPEYENERDELIEAFNA